MSCVSSIDIYVSRRSLLFPHCWFYLPTYVELKVSWLKTSSRIESIHRLTSIFIVNLHEWRRPIWYIHQLTDELTNKQPKTAQLSSNSRLYCEYSVRQLDQCSNCTAFSASYPSLHVGLPDGSLRTRQRDDDRLVKSNRDSASSILVEGMSRCPYWVVRTGWGRPKVPRWSVGVVHMFVPCMYESVDGRHQTDS